MIKRLGLLLLACGMAAGAFGGHAVKASAAVKGWPLSKTGPKSSYNIHEKTRNQTDSDYGYNADFSANDNAANGANGAGANGSVSGDTQQSEGGSGGTQSDNASNGAQSGSDSSGTQQADAGSGGQTASGDIEKVIAVGMKYLGTPYEFGSDRSNDKTFDCSDFTKWIFREALNIDLPSDSRKQGEYVKERGDVVTDWHQLKRGDLMFFMSYRGSKESDYSGIDKSSARITHVGLYLGDGKVLQTYSVKSGGVRIDSIEGTAWEYRFLFGGSVV